MLTSPTSRWSAGAVFLTLLVLVASWFLLIGPRRDEASALQAQTVSAQTQATSLQTQIAQLKDQFGDLAKRKKELAAIKEQLPPLADMPDVVRNLQNYAASSGVSLDSLAPGTPAIYAGGDAAAAGTGPGVAQAGDIVEIPVNITISGDYFEDALFVKSLQTKLTRAYLVTGLVTSEDEAGGTTTSSDTTGIIPATAPAVTPTTSAIVTAPEVSLQISGSVFVLADDTTSLASVDEAAQDAAQDAQTPVAKASAAASDAT